MKLYRWIDVLEGYYPGQIAAYASTVEEARRAVVATHAQERLKDEAAALEAYENWIRQGRPTEGSEEEWRAIQAPPDEYDTPTAIIVDASW